MIGNINQRREIQWDDPRTESPTPFAAANAESASIELFRDKTIRSLMIEFGFEGGHDENCDIIITVNNKVVLVDAPLHVLQLESMYTQDVETLPGNTLFLNLEINPITHEGALCNQKIKSVQFKVRNNDAATKTIDTVKIIVNEMRRR